MKREDLKYVSQCFRGIKAKQNVDTNIKTIERTLGRMFENRKGEKYKFKINIVENTSKKFFGMCVYCSPDYISSLAYDISYGLPLTKLQDMWSQITSWVIEIDSMLLYDAKLGATPDEITASLLHELGHVCFTNQPITRLKKVYDYYTRGFSRTSKVLLLKNPLTRYIMQLSLIETCSVRNFKRASLNKEKIADNFVFHMGYAEDLTSMIDKIILTYGNKNVNRNESELEADVKCIVEWGLDNVEDLQNRKKSLARTLQREYFTNVSKYTKDLIGEICERFVKNSKVKRSDHESCEVQLESAFINMQDKYVSEAYLSIFNNIGKLKKIDKSEIDILRVEVDRMKTYDDKIYIIERIYDYLEIVDTGLTLIEDGKAKKVQQSKDTLTRFKKDLMDILFVAKNTKIVEETKYGVFVKYPKGYEG